jgi:hypothetical protein
MRAANDNTELVTATAALQMLHDAGASMNRITLWRNYRHRAVKIFGRIYYPRQEIETLLTHERAA